jgi:hypothetical protein
VAQRGREAAAKRGRERARQERKQAKAEQKSASSDSGDSGVEIDEAGLMDEFRVLSEKHAAGQISDEILRIEKRRIFVALGIETAHDA